MYEHDSTIKHREMQQEILAQNYRDPNNSHSKHSRITTRELVQEMMMMIGWHTHNN